MMAEKRLKKCDRRSASDLQGWLRRTTIDEPRLSELVDLYEELGFEVVLRPPSPDELGAECSECYMADPDRFRTIYTRPRGHDSPVPPDSG